VSLPSEKEPRPTDESKTPGDTPDPNVEHPKNRIITESEDLSGDIETFVDKPKEGKKK